MHHLIQRRLRPSRAQGGRCQRRASSALVAETAVRTFGGGDVLGRVPSGSREGRVPSVCITFFGFGLCNYHGTLAEMEGAPCAVRGRARGPVCVLCGRAVCAAADSGLESLDAAASLDLELNRRTA